nr:LapA family protein [Pseudomonas donghuensis]
MRNFKRLILVVFLLLLGLVVLAFVLENQQPTAVMFAGFKTPDLPLSVLMISFFASGLVCGPLAFYFTRLFGRRKN